jgi:hypothetical protein
LEALVAWADGGEVVVCSLEQSSIALVATIPATAIDPIAAASMPSTARTEAHTALPSVLEQEIFDVKPST